MLKHKVKQTREERGFSQKEFAERMDMAISTYASKENGDRKFTVLEAIKVSEILEVDLKTLFKV